MNLTPLPIKKVFDTLVSWKRPKCSKHDCILYKIVDSHQKNNTLFFKIQCINTKVVFDALLQDIVLDADLLYGLHPIQGCYVGIEYALFLKSAEARLRLCEKASKVFSKYSASRYGNKRLIYQDRNGLLGIQCKVSGRQYLMEPSLVALTRELIEEFDVIQAFSIGMFYGLKLNRTSKPRAQVINDVLSTIGSGVS